jgi:hypothetical protein
MIRQHTETLCKNLSSWFMELAALAQQTDDSSSLPRLEILLRSGQVVRGSILKVQTSAHEQWLMILGPADAYTQSELTFLSGNEVVALTLLEPERYLKQFVVTPDPKHVGALELKRAAQHVEAELEKNLQLTIGLQVNVNSIPEQARWDVLRTIGFLPSLLSGIASDELGRKQVRENIAAICIEVANKNQTLLIHNTLTLKLKTPLSVSVTKEKERLKSEIEQLL